MSGPRFGFGWPGHREFERLLRSPLGALAEMPWLDTVGIFALRRWYFPLSRLWAAAGVADGLVTRFLAAAGIAPGQGAVAAAAQLALARFGQTQRRLVTATAAWDDAFFGAAPPAADALAAIEAERLSAAFAHMTARAAFYPLWALADAPPVRWDIAPPAEVEAIYGPLRATPALAYAAPDGVDIATSPRHPTGAGTRRWLRFASPSARMGDTAFARVTEPAGESGAPVVIVANGVCIEVDYLEGGLDTAATLASMGLRVVELVTPWHGRRTEPGWYAGEAFFGRAPLGTIDLFTAEVKELAALIGWARAEFGAPVGLLGFSLGALASQLVATHCAGWPEALRPDAVMLVAHSGRIDNVTYAGRLTAELGLARALAAAGWARSALEHWIGLVNPGPAPGIDASRIVSVVGLADRITPPEDGIALCDRWRIPRANRFVSNQCHFSKPVHLYRHRAPVERFVSLLRGAD